jgi:hypothetical protein
VVIGLVPLIPPGSPYSTRKNMKSLIDQALDYFTAMDANAIPGQVPSDMQTGRTQDDWIYWQPIDSNVSDSDIFEMEQHFGFKFPPSYIDLLKHKHFIELHIGEVSFFKHPSVGWKSELKEAVSNGYPKDHLITKGYFPFAHFSDWGLWCFGVNERDQNGECAIYLWDHEQPELFKRVADNIRDGLLYEKKKQA